MENKKLIKALFDGKNIRGLFIEQGEDPTPARYSMVIKGSDLLTPDEKDGAEKEMIIRDRINVLVSELKKLNVNPMSDICFELTLDETAMSNPEVKKVFTEYLDKYKEIKKEPNNEA